jgi:lysophospholipase L1-like esterase
MPGGQRARGRRWRRGLIGSLLALAMALALGELVVRVTGDRERALAGTVNRTSRRWLELMRAGLFEEIDDPVRRYAMRPGARAEIDGWSFRVSSHRTRGADFPLQKPPDEKRLIALGDSFCFGMWCDDSQTLVGHLAALASAAEAAAGSGVTWRGIALGVPGYTSAQYALALEQDGLALDPDAVVVYFNTNDIQREGFMFHAESGSLYGDHLPLAYGWKRALWRWSHLYGFISRQIERRWMAREDGALDPDVPWSHVRADNQRATSEALERIARQCRERGIGCFMVDQPLMTWSEDARRPGWNVLPLVAWAEAERARLGLPGIDLLPFLQGFADGRPRERSADGALPERDFLPERYFADEEVQKYFRGEQASLPADVDFHLTGEGYGHIAGLAYPLLREAGILP